MKALKRISLFISFSFIFAVLLGFVIPKTSAKAINREVKSTYIQNFSNVNSLNDDFRFCYQSEKGADSEWSSLNDTTATMRWERLSDSSGNYVHCNGADSVFDNDKGSQGAAIMTYVGKKYVNFKLTVDFKKDNGTYYWPVVAFRQLLPGKVFNEDGIGAFVQMEGYITLWGCSDAGGPYESAPIPNYEEGNTAYEWHTMVVEMFGIDCYVYIDPGTNAQPNYTYKFPASMFRSGYISLIALNNRASFRNLKIEEYKTERLEDYTEDPVPSADTEDSIDYIIEHSGPFSVKFFEKDGTTLIEDQTVAYDATTTAPNPPEAEEGYHFVGYFSDYGEEFKDGETKIKGASSWIATYELNVYGVSFYLEDGTFLTVVMVSYGHSIENIPVAPAKEGYNFDGYYSGNEKLTEQTVFRSEASYTAKYVKASENPSGGGGESGGNVDDGLEGWSMFGCGAAINDVTPMLVGFIAIGAALTAVKVIVRKKSSDK